MGIPESLSELSCKLGSVEVLRRRRTENDDQGVIKELAESGETPEVIALSKMPADLEEGFLVFGGDETDTRHAGNLTHALFW